MKRPAGLVLLLLALFLPLQGFAIAAACDTAAVSPASASHCPGHAEGAPRQGAHHECGTCCLALTTAPAPLPAGRVLSGARQPHVALTPHPTVLLERLDRPPRG